MVLNEYTYYSQTHPESLNKLTKIFTVFPRLSSKTYINSP